MESNGGRGIVFWNSLLMKLARSNLHANDSVALKHRGEIHGTLPVWMYFLFSCLFFYLNRRIVRHPRLGDKQHAVKN